MSPARVSWHMEAENSKANSEIVFMKLSGEKLQLLRLICMSLYFDVSSGYNSFTCFLQCILLFLSLVCISPRCSLHETCQMQVWAYCFSLTESNCNDFGNVLAISFPSVNSVSGFNHHDVRNVWILGVFFFLIILILVLFKQR